MLTEFSVKNCWYNKNLCTHKAIAILTLALVPVTSAAVEWPSWQRISGHEASLTFNNNETITLRAPANPNPLNESIFQLRTGGHYAVRPATVPVYINKVPPSAVVLTPDWPNEVTTGNLMLELDLSDKTITPGTTFGLGDMPGFNLMMILYDINDNELSRSSIISEHYTIDYSGLPTSNVVADRNVVLNGSTGILSLGPNDDEGNYNESGLTLFSNFPKETAKLKIVTTQDDPFGDHMQVYFGELSDPLIPHVDGDKLILPVVTAGDEAYYVELIIEQGTEPPIIQVTYADKLTTWNASNASFFENGILTIVNVQYNSELWWGQFELIQENPYRFRLLAAGVDDDDDDDDGIPDIADAKPYTPSSPGDPSGIAGNWNFTFEIFPASQVQGTACQFDAIESFETGTITYDQATEEYSISVGLFNGSLTVDGLSLFYAGIYSEEEGQTDSSVSLQRQSPTSMNGSEIWTWTAQGQVPCVNIHSKVTATR